MNPEYSSPQGVNYPQVGNYPAKTEHEIGPSIQQPVIIQDQPQMIPVHEPSPRDVKIAVDDHRHHNAEDKIPVVSRTMAMIILIMNIFLPGWGTVVLGFLSPHHTTYFILIGLLQFILVGLIIGWVWAIITGVKTWNKASRHHEENYAY
jgi:hypothetical protein